MLFQRLQPIYCVLALVFSGVLVLMIVELARRSSASKPKTPPRACPFCAEIIRPEAKMCHFCGRDLPEGAAGEPPHAC